MAYRPRTRRDRSEGPSYPPSGGVTPFNRRFGNLQEQRTPLPAIPPLPRSSLVQRQITDDLDLLLSALPERVAGPLRDIEGREGLLEVVMDLGRPPEARFPGREVVLSEGEVTP